MATSLYNIRDTGGVVTKNDIILGAYSQLRISGITRQPTPEDLEIALVRLEDMAAQYDIVMPVGYNFEDIPNPNSDSGIPRGLKIAFETNLAVRLIPDFNKEVPQALFLAASGALSQMASISASMRVRQVNYPNRQPVGSGNYRNGFGFRFYQTPGSEPINSANTSMFIGDTTDYTEHFDAYLKEGETIQSYTVSADSGLTISNQSNTDNDITYRIQAGVPSSSNSTNVLQITIIMTSSIGRVETRRRYIQVVPRH